MKHALIRSVISFLSFTKAYRLLCPFFSGNGLILAMHRVVADTRRYRIGASSRIEVTPEFLEALIRFFKDKGYEIISLDTLYERLIKGQMGPPFVCFTFDDGYRDAYDTVFPIFKRHGAPFTVYIVTSFANGSAVLWWYMLEDLILGSDDFIELVFNQKRQRLPVSSHNQKEQAYNLIRNMLMNTPQDKIGAAVEELFAPHGIKAADYRSYQITWEQLMEMSKDPLVTIGSHTMSHFNLTKLDLGKVLKEISESKHILERKIGKPVNHFAYPFGSKIEASLREFEAVKACGFKTAVTLREGAIFPVHRNYTHCLPRIEITGRHQDLKLIDMRRCGLISLVRNGFKTVVAD